MTTKSQAPTKKDLNPVKELEKPTTLKAPSTTQLHSQVSASSVAQPIINSPVSSNNAVQSVLTKESIEASQAHLSEEIKPKRKYTKRQKTDLAPTVEEPKKSWEPSLISDTLDLGANYLADNLEAPELKLDAERKLYISPVICRLMDKYLPAGTGAYSDEIALGMFLAMYGYAVYGVIKSREAKIVENVSSES